MERKEPLRQCTGCGEMKPKKELVRIVKTPEGEIRLDSTGKLNGRGGYICRNMQCLEAAQKKKGLNRALKAPVSEEVFTKLKEELKDLE